MLIRALYDFYRLKRNLSLSQDELIEKQRKMLVAVVKQAYENVPFYHRKFDAAGIKPSDIRSVEDLRRIPSTRKQEIQSSQPQDMLASNVKIEDCVHEKTTGSSGRPLHIYLNKSASDYRFAVMARAYWENGLRPWHKMVHMETSSAARGTVDPRFRGVVRRLSIARTDPVAEQLKIFEEYKPDFIMSNPSSLAPIANMRKDRKLNFRPQLILTGSELLLPDEAKLIRRVFDCDSVDDYGSHELGPMSWECREHVGYHVNVDNVVLEFLDKDGENVAPDEQGNIVCTSLVNYSMPFIRYHIDDKGIPSDEKCPCGRPLPLMKIIEGREDDFLTTTDGRIISPLVLSMLWYIGNPDVTQFRIVQESRDRLTIQLEGLKTSLSKETMNSARSMIAEILGQDMQVEFQLVDKIEQDAGGKLRKIVSRLVQPPPVS